MLVATSVVLHLASPPSHKAMSRQLGFQPCGTKWHHLWCPHVPLVDAACSCHVGTSLSRVRALTKWLLGPPSGPPSVPAKWWRLSRTYEAEQLRHSSWEGPQLHSGQWVYGQRVLADGEGTWCWPATCPLSVAGLSHPAEAKPRAMVACSSTLALPSHSCSILGPSGASPSALFWLFTSGRKKRLKTCVSVADLNKFHFFVLT